MLAHQFIWVVPRGIYPGSAHIMPQKNPDPSMPWMPIITSVWRRLKSQIDSIFGPFRNYIRPNLNANISLWQRPNMAIFFKVWKKYKLAANLNMICDCEKEYLFYFIWEMINLPFKYYSNKCLLCFKALSFKIL